MIKKKNYYQKQNGNMIKVGVRNLVGISMLGATAAMAGGLPAGTAKTMANTAIGLQGVALLGPSLKYANDSFGMNKRPRRKIRNY